MKKVLQPKPAAKARNVRTEAEWSDIIRRYEACSSAEDQAEYLETINASRSSIFRWKRIILEQASPSVAKRDNSGIDRTIETLCSPRPLKEELLDAIAHFGSWLRWPASEAQCELGAAVLVARYFSARDASRSLSSLSSDEISILSRHVSLNEIALAIASNAPYSVDFWEFSDFYTKYAELDLITDTVGIMIAFGSISSKRKISLERLFNLVQAGFYGQHHLRSQSGFNKLWKRTGAAAPFFFVERYDSYFKWRFAPFEADYADYVDEIMRDADARRAYFAKGLWVIEALRERLGPNALAAVSFPAFPMGLEAVPIENFPIDETAGKIRDFIA